MNRLRGMHEPVDFELIAKAREGDSRSFAILVERHYSTVYRYAFRWCGSREDAEDVTQEVFLKLPRALYRFDNRAKFTTWLYRVVRNCAADHNRKTRAWLDRRVDDPPGDNSPASPDPGPEGEAIAGSIRRAVEELPPTLREAMLLVFGEGMSHREAARVIGCAETTVSWRIFKAKRRLRKVLS
ncbi:MAG: RNA polymerase sigma factor [Desulfobulbaceae bacterium]